MNARSRLLALVLALCMMLCACGGSAQTPETTEAPVQTTAPQVEAPADDGKVTYTVTVVDEAGAPIPGAMVQICLEACYPSITDANGQAKYTVAEEDYKVSFLSLPAGYTYSGEEQEFYFEDGSYELTVTLKAAG